MGWSAKAGYETPPLDVVPVPAGQSPPEYPNSGWIENIEGSDGRILLPRVRPDGSGRQA
jgi:hypothetical protein